MRAVTDLAKVRGVVALIECDACDGRGKDYASEASKIEVTCSRCNGDGVIKARLSLVEFEKVFETLAHARARITELEAEIYERDQAALERER